MPPDDPDALPDSTLAAQLAAKDARIAEQEAVIAAWAARIAEQDAVIAEQGTKIAQLEKQVAELLQKLGRNSGNSSLPPSSDGPGQRKGPPNRKGLRKRNRGGQKGHRGSRLKVPVGTPLSGRPPDRALRAVFPHKAPTFGLRASDA